MKIIAYLEELNGEINRASLEALRGAQLMAADLGAELKALTVNAALAEKASAFKLDEVLLIQSPQTENYCPLALISAVENAMNNESADLLVLAHSYQTRDWAARLSARMNIPMISDCIAFKNESELLFVKQLYQGKVNADIAAKGGKAIVAFQPGAYRMDELENGASSVRSVEMDLSDVPGNVRPGETFQESKGSVDLSKAEVIVSIGRGIAKEDNLPIAEEFAKTLNAELGSSRPIVDYGWIEHERQVGSSGQTVSPKLYFALGISGAVQHQVGIKGSDNIIAINKDKNAPIFELADYGVVADLFDIVEPLTEAIQNR